MGVDDACLSEELREQAFKHTTATLKKLDEIRRQLELPIEQLPIVINTYGNALSTLTAAAARTAAQEERDRRTKRLPLTMRSEKRIAAGAITEVIVRPQFLVFRPEDIAIHGVRASWSVHDIKVGNTSQFIKVSNNTQSLRGPVPGTEFGPGGVCASLKLETVQNAMDFVLAVEYVGPVPEGEVFEATVVGLAAW